MSETKPRGRGRSGAFDWTGCDNLLEKIANYALEKEKQKQEDLIKQQLEMVKYQAAEKERDLIQRLDPLVDRFLYTIAEEDEEGYTDDEDSSRSTSLDLHSPYLVNKESLSSNTTDNI